MTTPPRLPSFLALPLFLHVFPHITHLQTEGLGLRKEMESQAQLSQQHRSQTPSLQNFNIVVPAGTSLHVYRTAFAWSQLQQRVRQWQRAYQGRPTALETQGKTTETETRSSLATVYACTVPGWSIPGKIWMPTNQIRAISAGAHVPRELCARALQASQGI